MKTVELKGKDSQEFNTFMKSLGYHRGQALSNKRYWFDETGNNTIEHGTAVFFWRIIANKPSEA